MQKFLHRAQAFLTFLSCDNLEPPRIAKITFYINIATVVGLAALIVAIAQSR